MSTYLHLVCVDHDPPLKSTDEVGQHLTDLPAVRAVLASRGSDVMQGTVEFDSDDLPRDGTFTVTTKGDEP